MAGAAALEELLAPITDQHLVARIRAYCTRTAQLDQILQQLTRSFCRACPRNATYGCCDFAQEASKHMPPEFVAVQEMEASRHPGLPTGINGLCRYHCRTGCKLRYLKSPSCLGHLCDDLRENLLARFDAKARPFLDAMWHVTRGSLAQDEAGVLSWLDQAIRDGQTLVSE